MTDNHHFLCGLGLGIAAGFLFAPRPGVKTRAMLAEKAKEGQDYATRQGARIYNSASETLERGKKAVQTTAEGIADALDAGKRTLVG
jgi:gas vesicle protein